MAKKTNLSKKKGPKGKRARAKAKLERQWGEEAEAPAPLRSSKSRLAHLRSSSPTPEDEGITLLTQALRDVMGETGTLGMMRGPETHLRMPQAHFDSLMAGLDGIAVRDCTDIVRGMRMVKSAREIEKISFVCDVVSGVF